MNFLRFALKRAVSPVFLCLLLLTALLPPLAGAAGTTVRIPPAGCCFEDPADPDAQRLSAYLEKEGFIVCSDEAELRNAVDYGLLDAGVIIPAGLSEKLASFPENELLTFISSPSSLLPALWQGHAAAALFAVYAPYLTEDALSGSGLSREEIFRAYHDRLDRGLFTFRLESTEGSLIPADDRGTRFFTGALSLMLFITAVCGIFLPVTAGTKQLAARITGRAAFRSYYLPAVLVRLLLLLTAGITALLLGGQPRLLPALLLFLPLLALAAALTAHIPGDNTALIITAFLVILSLALCPIFTDLSLFLPVLGKLRLLLPPYWLWLLA